MDPFLLLCQLSGQHGQPVQLEGGVGDGRVSCGKVFDGLAKNLVGPGTLLDLTDQRADTADVCLNTF